jgi:hypothetical protein
MEEFSYRWSIVMQAMSDASADAMPRDFAVLLAGIGSAVVIGIAFLASVLIF